MDCSPPGSSVHGDSPGKNTRVGCHALLQGIFLIQGSNPGLPYCRWILCRLSYQASQVALVVKTHLPMQETQEIWVWSLGLEEPLEEEMATHSSILAWEIPGTEEPGELQSMGLQRVGHDWACMPEKTETSSVYMTHICQSQSPNSFLPLTPLVSMHLFSTSVSLVSALQVRSSLSLVLDSTYMH